jgi:hypothetical protein
MSKSTNNLHDFALTILLSFFAYLIIDMFIVNISIFQFIIIEFFMAFMEIFSKFVKEKLGIKSSN